MSETSESPPVGRRPRRLLAAVLAALGLAAVIGGGTAIAADVTRKPTAQERDKAGEKEIATRWRRLKTAEIFPETLRSGLGSQSFSYERNFPEPPLNPPPHSTRAGISRPASCAEALDREVADVLGKLGCRTVLRATYVDESGTLATTLGIAVMPTADAAARVESGLHTTSGSLEIGTAHGVKAVSFPGTSAESFDDSLRQDFAFQVNSTPYVFFRSSGWLLARGHIDRDAMVERFSFADTALGQVMHTFAPGGAPCTRKAVKC